MMLNKVQIVNSTAKHSRQLGQTLRAADKKEAERLGLDPTKAVFHAYHGAVYRKTALVNGEVAAMWGVVGTPLGTLGRPYLITGEAVEKISPYKFARIYMNEVQQMKKLFPVLENYVDASYTGAVRMLKLAGFQLGRLFNLGNSQFYVFTMKTQND